MFEGYKKIGWHIRKEKKRYRIAFPLLILTDLLILVPPRLMAILIDELSKGTATVDGLMKVVGLIVVSTLLLYVLDYLWEVNLFDASDTLGATLRSKLMEHFFTEDPVFYERFGSGDLMNRVTGDIESVTEMAGFGVMCIADGLVMPIFLVLVMIATTSWKLTLASIAPFLLLFYGTKQLGNVAYKRYRAAEEAKSDLNDLVVENVEGVRVVRAFGTEEREKVKFAGRAHVIYDRNIAALRLSALFFPVARIIATISYVVALLYGAELLRQGQITLGSLLAFMLYVGEFTWPMFALSEIVNMQSRGKAGLDRIEQVLKAPAPDWTSGKTPDRFESFEMRDYDFTYPSSDHKNLEGITFTVRRGMTVGIVGRTGAGKSTLIDQFLRFYPNEESYLMNGEPIEHFSVEGQRALIGLVTQENIIFSKSVLENIKLARPDATEEEVNRAIHAADFAKDLPQLKDGLDTMAGEKGVSLSGGQKQRISIARALLTEPEILILDDALSAVDAQTEKNILASLRRERTGMTNLIVSHRLSAVQNADLILVMERGRIIDRGTHDELIGRPGYYQEEYKLQEMEAMTIEA